MTEMHNRRGKTLNDGRTFVLIPTILQKNSNKFAFFRCKSLRILALFCSVF